MEFLTLASSKQTLEANRNAFAINTLFLPQDIPFDLLYKYLTFEKRKKKVFHCFESFCLNYFENSTARVVILLSNSLRGLCL